MSRKFKFRQNELRASLQGAFVLINVKLFNLRQGSVCELCEQCHDFILVSLTLCIWSIVFLYVGIFPWI